MLIFSFIIITTGITIGGAYDVACSPSFVRAPERQKYLLDYIRYEYKLAYPHAISSCMLPIRYADQTIMAYGYVFCSKGTSLERCDQCFQSATQAIQSYCGVFVDGAQASSEICSIRYESKPFCTP
ncbi:hypothetical protein LINPERHAP1_LOCUS31955 [Linum perenne]